MKIKIKVQIKNDAHIMGNHNLNLLFNFFFIIMMQDIKKLHNNFEKSTN